MKNSKQVTLLDEFETDVHAGLTRPGQKELASKYLYDDLGTALFEAITLLPEYGLTRAEFRLLGKHAVELPSRISKPPVVVELGSGSGEKARYVLPHLVKGNGLTYCPVDVSSAALVRCERDVNDLRGLEIVPIEDSYIEGLAAASKVRKPGMSLLVLFLGSSIGNFDPPVVDSFLKAVRKNLVPGDLFLVSTDLVKEFGRMVAAYDDGIGLTSAFNLNILARINRELCADFRLDLFKHEARYDPAAQRIEMHLRSRVDQVISVNEKFHVAFKQDETIWTESSYKFRPEQVRAVAEKAGFTFECQWIDTDWPFAQTLLRA